MRISFFSNSPWAKTGYGGQTALFVPRLAALGHELSIQAFYGLEGGALKWGKIPVYPRAFDGYGRDVIASHSAHFQADITITLLDVWVFDPALHVHGMRWVPWMPVDQQPLPAMILKKASEAYQAMVYSRFAERECLRAGLDVLYVPHGVDTKVFAQMHEALAREHVKLPADKWIVGMVAANKGASPSRKAFEPCLRAFRDFHRRHPDTLLYLHTHMGEENAGLNLPELLGVLGLEMGRDVMCVNQYDFTLGLPPEHMAALYNSMDCLLACSMGEGFGVPILEAQACGTPVITGDWTSMTELTWRGAMVARADADPFYTQLASYYFQPRAGAIAAALEQVYAKTWVRHVPDQVAEYDADYVTEHHWRPALDTIAERLELEKPAVGAPARMPVVSTVLV